MHHRGAELTRFPTAGHLAACAGRAPGSNITGGERCSGKHRIRRVDRRYLDPVRLAAARRRDTYLCSQFWRLARRIGKNEAAVAGAHSIIVICWHLLTHNCDYDDLGGDYFTCRNNPNANATGSSPNSTTSVTA